MPDYKNLKKLTTEAAERKANQKKIEELKEQALTNQKIAEEIEKAKTIVASIELQIDKAAHEGKSEILSSEKIGLFDTKGNDQNLKATDLKDKWAYVFHYFNEIPELKVSFEYQHDGVGMESWNKLKISW